MDLLFSHNAVKESAINMHTVYSTHNFVRLSTVYRAEEPTGNVMSD